MINNTIFKNKKYSLTNNNISSISTVELSGGAGPVATLVKAVENLNKVFKNVGDISDKVNSLIDEIMKIISNNDDNDLLDIKAKVEWLAENYRNCAIDSKNAQQGVTVIDGLLKTVNNFASKNSINTQQLEAIQTQLKSNLNTLQNATNIVPGDIGRNQIGGYNQKYNLIKYDQIGGTEKTVFESDFKKELESQDKIQSLLSFFSNIKSWLPEYQLIFKQIIILYFSIIETSKEIYDHYSVHEAETDDPDYPLYEYKSPFNEFLQITKFIVFMLKMTNNTLDKMFKSQYDTNLVNPSEIMKKLNEPSVLDINLLLLITLLYNTGKAAKSDILRKTLREFKNINSNLFSLKYSLMFIDTLMLIIARNKLFRSDKQIIAIKYLMQIKTLCFQNYLIMDPDEYNRYKNNILKEAFDFFYLSVIRLFRTISLNLDNKFEFSFGDFSNMTLYTIIGIIETDYNNFMLVISHINSYIVTTSHYNNNEKHKHFKKYNKVELFLFICDIFTALYGISEQSIKFLNYIKILASDPFFPMNNKITRDDILTVCNIVTQKFFKLLTQPGAVLSGSPDLLGGDGNASTFSIKKVSGILETSIEKFDELEYKITDEITNLNNSMARSIYDKLNESKDGLTEYSLDLIKKQSAPPPPTPPPPPLLTFDFDGIRDTFIESLLANVEDLFKNLETFIKKIIEVGIDITEINSFLQKLKEKLDEKIKDNDNTINAANDDIKSKKQKLILLQEELKQLFKEGLSLKGPEKIENEQKINEQLQKYTELSDELNENIRTIIQLNNTKLSINDCLILTTDKINEVNKKIVNDETKKSIDDAFTIDLESAQHFISSMTVKRDEPLLNLDKNKEHNMSLVLNLNKKISDALKSMKVFVKARDEYGYSASDKYYNEESCLTYNGKKYGKFERIYWSNSSIADLYCGEGIDCSLKEALTKSIRDVIMDDFIAYIIYTYGFSGSGKTTLLLGTERGMESDRIGIISRILLDTFDNLTISSFGIDLEIEYLIGEIYGEKTTLSLKDNNFSECLYIWDTHDREPIEIQFIADHTDKPDIKETYDLLDLLESSRKEYYKGKDEFKISELDKQKYLFSSGKLKTKDYKFEKDDIAKMIYLNKQSSGAEVPLDRNTYKKTFGINSKSTTDVLFDILYNKPRLESLSEPDKSKKTKEYERYYNKQSKKNVKTKEDIKEFGTEVSHLIDDTLNKIQILRRKRNRVRCTKYNPDSSRSHMFFLLKINGKYYIFIDKAGSETPYEIANDEFVKLAKRPNTEYNLFSIKEFESPISSELTPEKIKLDLTSQLLRHLTIVDSYTSSELPSTCTHFSKLRDNKITIKFIPEEDDSEEDVIDRIDITFEISELDTREIIPITIEGTGATQKQHAITKFTLTFKGKIYYKNILSQEFEIEKNSVTKQEPGGDISVATTKVTILDIELKLSDILNYIRKENDKENNKETEEEKRLLREFSSADIKQNMKKMIFYDKEKPDNKSVPDIEDNKPKIIELLAKQKKVFQEVLAKVASVTKSVGTDSNFELISTGNKIVIDEIDNLNKFKITSVSNIYSVTSPSTAPVYKEAALNYIFTTLINSTSATFDISTALTHFTIKTDSSKKNLINKVTRTIGRIFNSGTSQPSIKYTIVILGSTIEESCNNMYIILEHLITKTRDETIKLLIYQFTKLINKIMVKGESINESVISALQKEIDNYLSVDETPDNTNKRIYELLKYIEYAIEFLENIQFFENLNKTTTIAEFNAFIESFKKRLTNNLVVIYEYRNNLQQEFNTNTLEFQATNSNYIQDELNKKIIELYIDARTELLKNILNLLFDKLIEHNIASSIDKNEPSTVDLGVDPCKLLASYYIQRSYFANITQHRSITCNSPKILLGLEEMIETLSFLFGNKEDNYATKCLLYDNAVTGTDTKTIETDFSKISDSDSFMEFLTLSSGDNKDSIILLDKIYDVFLDLPIQPDLLTYSSEATPVIQLKLEADGKNLKIISDKLNNEQKTTFVHLIKRLVIISRLSEKFEYLDIFKSPKINILNTHSLIDQYNSILRTDFDSITYTKEFESKFNVRLLFYFQKLHLSEGFLKTKQDKFVADSMKWIENSYVQWLEVANCLIPYYLLNVRQGFWINHSIRQLMRTIMYSTDTFWLNKKLFDIDAHDTIDDIDGFSETDKKEVATKLTSSIKLLQDTEFSDKKKFALDIFNGKITMEEYYLAHYDIKNSVWLKLLLSIQHLGTNKDFLFPGTITAATATPATTTAATATPAVQPAALGTATPKITEITSDTIEQLTELKEIQDQTLKLLLSFSRTLLLAMSTRPDKVNGVMKSIEFGELISNISQEKCQQPILAQQGGNRKNKYKLISLKK